MSYKILIIGCGNIGAGYDFDNGFVQTHAKAFFLHPKFTPTFFDLDSTLAEKVANQYEASFLTNLEEIELSEFDCISICTPTTTHTELLIKAFEAKVKLVVCEKPVASELEDLKSLQAKYQLSDTRVVVNYIRRFLPCYIDLKLYIQEVLKTEPLTNLSIRYQRGFVNNAGHALDLVQYLLGAEMELENVETSNHVFDAFPNDPTMSLRANWDGVNVDVLGISNVKFSHFEVDIFFEYHRIHLKEAGNIIEVSKADKEGVYFKPLKPLEHQSKENCLRNYMEPVAELAHNILAEKVVDDNFEEAVRLNLQMLNFIKH